MSLGTLQRYWNTLRWLRPVQVYGRVWFRLYRPRPDLRPALCLRPALDREWRCCSRPASLTGSNRFRLLSVERSIESAGDWNRSDWPKLWLYNAHYFDDLAADAATSRESWHRALIARWIAENPPGQGNGWEPYPLSLRLVNWAKWLGSGREPVDGMLHSMAVQARWLRRRLEHHLLGNHLWANAKALVFAGCVFEGDEAEGWLCEGLRLLRRELREQILPDGGHFERSPMYHAIVLEDVLDLLQLSQRFPQCVEASDRSAWQDAASRMLRWLQVMSHPDGGIAFFNDAALDVAPDLAVLGDYATALGLAAEEPSLGVAVHLPDSGFVRLQAGRAVLIADVDDVGPSYLPGHAHAGTLSFELSIGTQRVLVNSGTSTYAANALRLAQRGTAAHNTVEVDGLNSSEVWSSFRVARRARVSDVACGRDDGACWLQAAHDGYRRLRGKVMHRRRWRLSAQELIVEDVLEGEPRAALARFHFAPGASLEWRVDDAEAEVRAANWYPRFGASESSSVLCVKPNGSAWSTHFSWSES